MPNALRIVTLAAALLAAAPAFTAEPCGICARKVVINGALAACFLERYPQLAERDSAAVAVDLADCEQERGVVAALRGPAAQPPAQPDLRFMLSLSQLACLKQRLEAPGVELDPSATIDLDSCG